jgi:hypothetical protein
VLWNLIEANYVHEAEILTAEPLNSEYSSLEVENIAHNMKYIVMYQGGLREVQRRRFGLVLNLFAQMTAMTNYSHNRLQLLGTA